MAGSPRPRSRSARCRATPTRRRSARPFCSSDRRASPRPSCEPRGTPAPGVPRIVLAGRTIGVEILRHRARWRQACDHWVSSNGGHVIGTGLLDADDEQTRGHRLELGEILCRRTAELAEASVVCTTRSADHNGSVWPDDTVICARGMVLAEATPPGIDAPGRTGSGDRSVRPPPARARTGRALGDGRIVAYPAACRPRRGRAPWPEGPARARPGRGVARWSRRGVPPAGLALRAGRGRRHPRRRPAFRAPWRPRW